MSSHAAAAPTAWIARLGRRRLALVVIGLATVVYVLVAVFFSLREHDAFLTGYDLANLNQVLWLLAHGYEPMNTQDGRLFWGEHFSPALALLTPLYALGAGARTLLVVQALTMAVVAPLLYALARAYGARPWLAAVPALLWLLSPLTLLANLFDVHHVPLAAPLIVGSILALRGERLWLFVVLGVVACCAKEDVLLLYAMLGLVVALEGRRRLGAAIAGASLAAFVVVIGVFMPAFSDSASWFAKRFAGSRGDSLTDVFVWMARHPLAAAGDLVTTKNLTVCAVLVLMTGGICLLAARWMLLGLPVLAHNLLSAYPSQHELATHYFVPVALAFSIAAAVGVHRVAELGPRTRIVIGACVVTAALSSAIGVNAARTGSEPDAVPGANAAGVDARRDAVALIPREAVVAATPRLSAHLSSRREIYALPLPFLGRLAYGADWSSEEMARRAERVRWVVLDTDDRPTEFPHVAERVVPVLRKLGFAEIYRRGSVAVYVRREPTRER